MTVSCVNSPQEVGLVWVRIVERLCVLAHLAFSKTNNTHDALGVLQDLESRN